MINVTIGLLQSAALTASHYRLLSYYYTQVPCQVFDLRFLTTSTQPSYQGGALIAFILQMSVLRQRANTLVRGTGHTIILALSYFIFQQHWAPHREQGFPPGVRKLFQQRAK